MSSSFWGGTKGIKKKSVFDSYTEKSQKLSYEKLGASKKKSKNSPQKKDKIVLTEAELYCKKLMTFATWDLEKMCNAKQLIVQMAADKNTLVNALANSHYGDDTSTENGSITINKYQRHQPGVLEDENAVPVAELLVEGYLRLHLKRNKNSYPQVLTRVICEFMDDIWVLPEKFNNVMKRNGSVIFRPPFSARTIKKVKGINFDGFDHEDENIDMIIGYSHGSTRGILNFELKCINPSKDAIGIMSEIEECEKMQWIAATKGNSYYYTSGSGIYSGRGTVNSPPEQYYFGDPWQIGDTVKISVDLDKSLCSFYKNKVQIGTTIKIEPNCTYHPVLATSVDMCEYELIL